MADIDQAHKDVVMVTDKVVAANLFAMGHQAVATVEVASSNKFFSLFNITHRLRRDIRDFDRPGMRADERFVKSELDDIDMYLGDERSYLEHEFQKTLSHIDQ